MRTSAEPDSSSEAVLDVCITLDAQLKDLCAVLLRSVLTLSEACGVRDLFYLLECGRGRLAGRGGPAAAQNDFLKSPFRRTTTVRGPASFGKHQVETAVPLWDKVFSSTKKCLR